jgi:hypothetical protein
MREPGETVSEEEKCATQEKHDQNEGGGAASFLIGSQRGIVDLWQLLLMVGHVGAGLASLSPQSYSQGVPGAYTTRAKTTHQFGDAEVDENREWFTGGEQFPKDGTVHFFGVWVSRDSLYIAARDAQLRILSDVDVGTRPKAGTSYSHLPRTTLIFGTFYDS